MNSAKVFRSPVVGLAGERAQPLFHAQIRLVVLQERKITIGAPSLCEPRGSDVLVGAFLLSPSIRPAPRASSSSTTPATWACAATAPSASRSRWLIWAASIGPPLLETPVGTVRFELQTGNRVSIRNVPAYRHRAGVTVMWPATAGHRRCGLGRQLVFPGGRASFTLDIDQVEPLTAFTWKPFARRLTRPASPEPAARRSTTSNFSPPAHDPANHSRNFVLCPGKAYDRSPCGTGTSAKMACLAADGSLKPGEDLAAGRHPRHGFRGQFQLRTREIDAGITGAMRKSRPKPKES
jgi:4-hydroxyproline epimerase